MVASILGAQRKWFGRSSQQSRSLPDRERAVRNAVGEFELKACDNVKYLSEFEQAKIYQNGVCVGYIGRVDVRVEAARDLPRTYLCEIEFEKLKFEGAVVKAYSKFPALRDRKSVV